MPNRKPVIPLTGTDEDRLTLETQADTIVAGELHTTSDQKRLFLNGTHVAPVYHGAVADTAARIALNASSSRGAFPGDSCRQTDTGVFYFCVLNRGEDNSDWIPVEDGGAAIALAAMLGATAFSNDYNDLANLPSIPTVPGQKNSIELDAGDIQLVGDAASPGNNKVYGTSGAGAKGWKDDPAGGGGSGLITASAFTMNTAKILGRVTAGVGAIEEIDYDEGTFTPTFSFVTPGDLSVSYTLQDGFYVRIGRLVTVGIVLLFTPTHTTASGNAFISGLPFTSKSGSTVNIYAPIGLFSSVTFPASNTYLTILLGQNSAAFGLRSYGSGSSSTPWSVTQFATGQSRNIQMSFSYFI